MTTRRKALSILGISGLGAIMPQNANYSSAHRDTRFRFCLNTISVSKQPLDLKRYVDIASMAGYDCIEIWIRDLEQFLESGNMASDLRKYLDDKNITIENAIGFAPWLAEGEAGFTQMQREMEMLSSIGCRRIAAPAAGLTGETRLDLFKAGERYGKLLELGRQAGVMPQLEFWGSSGVLWHIGQALLIVAASGDKDARILPDVYHMFRGNSSFETLKLIDGSLIEVFHFNDFVSSVRREDQRDSDRVYPGDGVAPFKRILEDLKHMGGEKVLSLELFNETYWKQDPLDVAKTGLQKMKNLF
jgi:sugar phosphate isomerase/epimerase